MPTLLKHQTSFDVKFLTCFLVLNPGQTPVLAFDQPLYAIAKNIQWNLPDNFGGDKFVIMMGGVHIEMGFLALMGSYLTGSGWVEALEESSVTTSGKADSFLRGAHVKRSRYVIKSQLVLYISF